jgi:hypothetical protein
LTVSDVTESAGGVEPATVFALLRACLAGDEAGAASIIESWDDRLAELLRLAAVPPA